MHAPFPHLAPPPAPPARAKTRALPAPPWGAALLVLAAALLLLQA
jgi:hypothetical protein